MFDIARKPLLSILLSLFLLSTIIWADGDDSDGESRFLKNSRQLIYDGKRSGEGYFSPDGKAMIFQSEREPGNPFFQIYILGFETGDTWRVSPGVGKTTCSFFRPGTDQALFASTHLDPDAVKKQKEEIELRKSGRQKRYSWDYDVNMDIFSAKRDGSDLKRLTDSYGYDAEGDYSPDGGKIVFCSMRDAYPADKLSAEDQKRLELNPSYFGEIYIMDADGSHQQRLTRTPGYDGGPFFSPDGQRIIWRRFNTEGTIADVFTMKLDGSDVQQITDFKSMSWAPYFHPSGEYIIFTSNKLGFSNFELYIVDKMGKKTPVRVTFTDGFDGLPVFSPDGKRLAWTTNRTADGASQIFLADWNHEAALAALKAAPDRSPKATAGKFTEHKFEIDRVKRLNDQGMAVDAPAGKGIVKTLSPKITEKDFRAEVGYLASDALEGRMTGSEGSKKAEFYLANYLKSLELKPAGENDTYYQNFPFTAGVKALADGNHLRIKLSDGSVREFALDADFRPLGFTENGKVEGEVVFAGYGLRIPGEPGKGYDSYESLDVTDKIVLALRYAPEDVEMARRQALNRYAGLRYKALVARENGAKGLLIVTGPNSPNAGELVKLGFDQSMGNSGIPVASVSSAVAEALFAAAGKNLKTVQTELDRENPHFESTFPLKNATVTLQTSVKREKKHDHNVLALLPPADGVTDAQYIMLGAHYDHLGYGTSGSLAHKDEQGQIHNGADDNASGTSLVMEAAAALAKLRAEKPDDFKRGIIFALWSGEEIGIVGSSYFAENPTIPLKKIVAYVNFDMVGRLRKNTLTLQGIGSSNIWKKMLERRNVMAGFNLSLVDDPYQPTDVTAFYPKGVPVLGFFTGSHEEYHRPVDDPETLNYEGLVRIGNFAKNIAYDLARGDETPDYLKVERKASEQGDRASLRAYLGTIPDYIAEIEGVKLSGVKAGGPADKAGVQGGDIIVGLAGQKITNIYDYTYALDAVKIGKATEMIVMRDGKKVTLTIVPESRK